MGRKYTKKQFSVFEPQASGHSFSLGLHTTVVQPKAYVTQNIKIGYTGRNLYTLSDSQAATKALANFQINSKLIWESHQSMTKLAGHYTIQLVWLPGHLGIDVK
jgi:hypothetical protein